MTYKEKLESELLYNQSGGADLYLYRNPREPRIVEQISPPDTDERNDE